MVWAQDVRMAIPAGHTVPLIKDNKFSADEKYFASLDVNGNLFVWDVPSGACLSQFSGVSQFDWDPSPGAVLFAKNNELFRYEIKNDRAVSLKTFSASISNIKSVQGSRSFYVLDQLNSVFKSESQGSSRVWKDTEIPGFKVASPYRFSPDGSMIVFLKGKDSIVVWSLLRDKRLYATNGYTDIFSWSGGGGLIAFGNVITETDSGAEYGIHLIDLSRGSKSKNFVGHINGRINDLSFSSDGKYLASASNDYSLQVQEVHSGKLISKVHFGENLAMSCKFNPMNDHILVSTTTDLNVISGAHFNSKKRIDQYSKWHTNRMERPAISVSGKYFASSDGSDIKVYSGFEGMKLRELRNQSNAAVISRISPNSKYLVTIASNNFFHGSNYRYNIIVQDIETGIRLAHFDQFEATSDFLFSENGSLLIVYSYFNEPVRIYNLDSLSLSWEVPQTQESLQFVRLSPDKKFLALGSRDSIVRVYDLERKILLDSFECENGFPLDAEFTSRELIVLSSASTLYRYIPLIQRLVSIKQISFDLPQDDWDGMDVHPSLDYMLAYDNLSGAIMIYNLYRERMELAWSEPDPCNVRFTGTGDRVISGTNVFKVDWESFYELVNRGEWPVSKIDSGEYRGFTSDCAILQYSGSDKILFRSTEREKGVIRALPNSSNSISGHFGGITEVSFDSSERFLLTSSETGSSKLWDVHSGELLLTQYFFDGRPDQWLVVDPKGYFDGTDQAMSLLHWIIDGEVVGFDQLKREFWIPGLWKLKLEGSVDHERQSILTTDLYPEIEKLQVAEDTILVKVKRRSGGYGPVSLHVNGKEIAADIREGGFDSSLSEQWLSWAIDSSFLTSGDNTISVYTYNNSQTAKSRGAKAKFSGPSPREELPPKFYGIVVGVSEFSEPSLNLNLPGKDAKAIMKAMHLAASNLFGPENVYLNILSSDTGTVPGKAEIQKVLDTITYKARSQDVIFIYLSGHGIADEGNNGEFYFLTKDASSTDLDVLNQRVESSDAWVSSTDWVKFIKGLKARKQFMVIDACGAGKAVENLSLQRGVSRTQIKAIDRMRDRTGMFVLSGCAADAVSYESSVFGQGVLTYAILEGMRGAALQVEGEIDVQTVMTYARERVPELARDIGAIQEPQCLFASGGSFPVGILTENDRESIPLSNPKPVLVKAMILSSETIRDDLGLSSSINKRLTERSGDHFIFLPVDQYPGGGRITGLYSVHNDAIELRLVWTKSGREIQQNFSAKSVESLMESIGKWLDAQAFQ